MESSQSSLPPFTPPSRPHIIVQIVTALLPFALGIGLITIRLPPWAEDMAKLWGPAFVVIGMIVAGFIRYVPTGILHEYTSAQRIQAVALGNIAQSLELISREIADLSGMKEALLDVKSALQEGARLQQQNNDRLARIEGMLYALVGMDKGGNLRFPS